MKITLLKKLPLLALLFLQTQLYALVYDVPGEYNITWTFTDVSGNSSTAIQSVFVNYLDKLLDEQTACDSYTWINGVTYTESATDSFVSTNESGCEILNQLNLEITTIDTSIRLENKMLIANQDGAKYQWIDCDDNNAPIFGATQQTFAPTVDVDEGNYAVIISLNGCEEVSECSRVSIVDLPNDDPGKIEINTYPNPTNGRVNLVTEKPINGIVRVVDLSGRVILNKSISNKTKFFIDINGVPGVYYIEVISNETTQFFTILKK